MGQTYKCLSVCLQCGCTCNWTIRRFALPELQKYCKVSTSQEQHTGHGPDAEQPQLTRRGCLSTECKEWIEDLALTGLPNHDVLERVRTQVEHAFADDPTVEGGLQVCDTGITYM